jgi:hypothetical protein
VRFPLLIDFTAIVQSKYRAPETYQKKIERSRMKAPIQVSFQHGLADLNGTVNHESKAVRGAGTCAPQKPWPPSCGTVFPCVFVMKSIQNVLRSDPTITWHPVPVQWRI